MVDRRRAREAKPHGALTVRVRRMGCGCGGDAGRTDARHAAGGQSPVAQRRSDDRPPLVLVARTGDPHGAVAFAAAHDLGASASPAAATLLGARLREQGFSERALARAVARLHPRRCRCECRRSAAFRPGAYEARSQRRRALRRAGPRRRPGGARLRSAIGGFRDPAMASVAECTGELGDPRGRSAPRPRAFAGRRQSSCLASVRSVERAAFAAVGPSRCPRPQRKTRSRPAAIGPTARR